MFYALFQFDAEYRRFSVSQGTHTKFDDFYKLVASVHQLDNVPFIICYVDPKDADLLPINNDDNFWKALSTSMPLMRLNVQKKGKPSKSK